MHDVTGSAAGSPVVRHPALAAALGALIGVTWAAALRAYMVVLADTASAFSWWTIGAVLLPGAIAGGCIGLAHALHARRARRAWLLGFAPIAFALLAMLEPGALEALLTAGLGGGAIGVALALVLGGFGLGSIGSRAGRVVGLGLALLLTAGVAATVPLIGGSDLALSTPKGAWATALAAGLLLCGILGTAIAFRPPPPMIR
ncbi:hypothetical protein [Agrococcus citreus]|uniref:Major facilitator superfamily (MFS) profile domain-containing protein n=1 Tax=Agrococcus citreus TaxID=84643 RepID=A0ABN1YNC8_9MICO